MSLLSRIFGTELAKNTRFYCQYCNRDLTSEGGDITDGRIYCHGDKSDGRARCSIQDMLTVPFPDVIIMNYYNHGELPELVRSGELKHYSPKKAKKTE